MRLTSKERRRRTQAAERFRRMNSTPEARRRAVDRAKRLNAHPAFRASRGWLTVEQRRMIVSEIIAGGVYVDIAVNWLIGTTAVSKIARANGIHRCPRKLTREKVTEVIDQISAGRPVGEIARELNVHQSTISHIKHGRGWLSIARIA